ncbi:hypothetical protein AB9M93_11380 [Peribacillus frigoritolerans]
MVFFPIFVWTALISIVAYAGLKLYNSVIAEGAIAGTLKNVDNNELPTVFLRKCKKVDFHSRHSLSAGGPPSAPAPAGSPFDVLFPQESRTPAPINFVLTFRWNFFCRQQEGAIRL